MRIMPNKRILKAAVVLLLLGFFVSAMAAYVPTTAIARPNTGQGTIGFTDSRPPVQVTFHQNANDSYRGPTRVVDQITRGRTVNSSPNSGIIANFPDPNPGYQHRGWYTDPIASNGTRFHPGSTPVDPPNNEINLNVYARWVRVHRVTFNPDGGTRTGGGILSQLVNDGGNATLPIVERAGYTFLGWTPAGSHENVTEDRTLTARWERIIRHTVTFDVNGGNRTGGGQLTQTVNDGGNATLPTVERAGYRFLGWTPAGSHENVTEDRALTARWERIPTGPPPTQPPTTQPPTTQPPPTTTPPPTEVEEDEESEDGETAVIAPPPTTPPPPPPENPSTPVPGPPPEAQPLPATPAAPIAQYLTAEIVPEEDEYVIIDFWGVPLFAPWGSAAWALVNLILTVVGVVLAVVTILLFLKRRKQDDEDEKEQGIEEKPAHAYAAGQSSESEDKADVEEEERKKKKYRLRLVMTILAPILAFLAIMLFILTQDMRNPMALIDMFTKFHAVLFAVKVVFMIVMFRRKKKYEDEEKNDEGETAAVAENYA